MARYGAEAAILRFRLPHVTWQGAPRWILWPASAWRVVAPRPRPRALNVLQRAVLGLAVVGTIRAIDISKRLMLAEDLAEYILEELQGAGWLDVMCAPTPEGRRALEEDMSEPVEDMTVGWVFTDPFSGQTWPRFHAGELPYARTAQDDRGRAMLLSGTVGDPREDRAFEVQIRPGDQHHASRPSAEDVLRAARTHRKHRDWEDEPVAVDPPVLQSVSFVLEQPTPCLLAARVWRTTTGDWQVDDPFGTGQGLRLRRWLEARVGSDQQLRRWLEPILGGDPEATDVTSLTQRAEWLVEERLGPGIRARQELRARLVEVQRTLLETNDVDCPEDKWDDLAVKAQRAAERAFLEIEAEHPRRLPLAADAEINESLFEGLARALGFDVPLPPSLSRVRRGKILHASEHGSGSLRSLVLLALLGASGAAEHPLARAARAEPRLLHKLDSLATTRDHAAHETTGGSAPAGRRREWIRDGVETVFSAVHLLFAK